MKLLRSQEAAWRGGTHPKYPDRAARAQERHIEGLSTGQGCRPESSHLAVLIDPLGDSAFFRIECQEDLITQTVTWPICPGVPLSQTTRSIREEQADLALEDFVHMACGSLK